MTDKNKIRSRNTISILPFSGWKSLLFLLFSLLLFSCSVTKLVPEDSYLVDKVSVHTDNKKVKSAELEPLILQKPNDPKFRLRLYSLAGTDSSWLSRFIRKLGTPPVLYSRQLTDRSSYEIHAELKNKGYLNNQVVAQIDTSRRKKARINYEVATGDPFLIDTFKVRVDNQRVDRILTRRMPRTLLKPGTIFDMDIVETERKQVAQLLQNMGYYAANIDNLHYLADTTLQKNRVDLTMIFKDTTLMRPYYIKNVTVYSGYDPLDQKGFEVTDSLMHKGLTIYYDPSRFLKPDVIAQNLLIRPGGLYSERRTTRSYNYLNALGCLSRSSIQYEEVIENDTAFLNCNVFLTPGNIHGIQVGLDGTNKAGNLGIAANITYNHHNIFNGGETFNIRLRGAYEFVNESKGDVLTNNYYEFGIQTGLSFPKIHIPVLGERIRRRFNVNTQYEIGLTVQKRPEYTREFFNFAWRYYWENDRKTLNQTLSLIDINYVMMPWKADYFSDYLNQDNSSLTRFSYDNVFTAGIAYNAVFTNQASGRVRQRLYTLRFGAESSGNLLNALFSLTNAGKSDTEQYNILSNPFAQYLKGDVSYTQTFRLSTKNSIAWRALIGAAYPYGNSTIALKDESGNIIKRQAILPFEKRYYSGGPNSVRGWSTRYLGPGSYSGDISNPAIHVGDLKLELNLEFRHKLIKWLELAAFTDAGNIWTLQKYPEQENGEFSWNRFYKEMAVGAGIGFRIDLSFLIIRVDGAKRVYDPAREEGKRWTFLKEGLKNNSGVYFAIGYPF